MENTESRSYVLAALASLFKISCRLSLWCYSTEGHLYFSTSPHEKEYKLFFEIGGCKDYAFTTGLTLNSPFLMSDPIGLVWVGEYSEITSSREKMLILMGPAFLSETSIPAIEEQMHQQNIPLPVRSIGKKVLPDAPVMTMNTLQQYIKMLHYAATEKPLEIKDIIYQSDYPSPADNTALFPSDTGNHFLDYEKAYAKEQVILQCIRDGNLDYRQVIGEFIPGIIPVSEMPKHPLREAKDSALIYNSLCCRAAMEGKLSIKAAKEIEIRYIRRIENSCIPTELVTLLFGMTEEYIQRVHELGSLADVSQPVRDCCDYIKAHFWEPITLSDLAKNACYSEYYLTRKFQREMGTSLKDYLLYTRLDYAKILLLATEDSVREISEKLQFGTRNYFSRIFREQEGCTPTEYRDRVRNIQST